MPFPLILAGAAEGHTLIEQAVVADLAGLADDDAHAVVNHQPPSDGRPGMDLDAGFFSCVLRDPSCQEKMPADIKPMGHPMPEHCVNAGIQEENLQFAAGGRVPALIGCQKSAQTGYSFCHNQTPCVRSGMDKKTPPAPKYERRRTAVPLSFITQGKSLTRTRRRASTSPALPDALHSSLRRTASSRRRFLSVHWAFCYSFRSSRYSITPQYTSKLPTACQGA